MISVEGINQRFREVEYITSFRGVLLEGTIKLMFDSVLMGVTGGAMVGATSRGGGGNTCKFDENEQSGGQ